MWQLRHEHHPEKFKAMREARAIFLFSLLSTMLQLLLHPCSSKIMTGPVAAHNRGK